MTICKNFTFHKRGNKLHKNQYPCVSTIGFGIMFCYQWQRCTSLCFLLIIALMCCFRQTVTQRSHTLCLPCTVLKYLSIWSVLAHWWEWMKYSQHCRNKGSPRVCIYITVSVSSGHCSQQWSDLTQIPDLVDRTLLPPTVLPLLSVTLCIVTKWCVLEQKLPLTAYRKSYQS